MNINTLHIKKDIYGQLKNDYLSIFPQLAPKINKFIEKPTCSICINDLLSSLKELPDLKERLSKIYKTEEIEIDIVLVPQSKQKSVYFEMPEAEFKNWFHNYINSFNSLQLRTYSTYFRPSDNKVIFTALIVTTE